MCESEVLGYKSVHTVKQAVPLDLEFVPKV